MLEWPNPKDYHLLIEREWADIHHSRIQEWTALGVVMGAHLGLIQLVKFAIKESVPLPNSVIIISASVIGAWFAVLGALVTCRHRRIMEVKLGWIFEAEDRLGLIKKSDNSNGIIPEDAKMKVSNNKCKLSFPPFLSVSGLIFYFYVTLFIVDIVVSAMVWWKWAMGVIVSAIV
jgi:hypothetical protein